MQKYCKQMRFIGDDIKFNDSIILDIDFDFIFYCLGDIENIIGYNQTGCPIGKPRFNCLLPSSHCNYPIISKDKYLIGFTDEISANCCTFKFANNAGSEYINEINLNDIEFLSFENQIVEFKNLNYVSNAN